MCFFWNKATSANRTDDGSKKSGSNDSSSKIGEASQSKITVNDQVFANIATLTVLKWIQLTYLYWFYFQASTSRSVTENVLSGNKNGAKFDLIDGQTTTKAKETADVLDKSSSIDSLLEIGEVSQSESTVNDQVFAHLSISSR